MKDRIFWKEAEKTKDIEFNFNEKWLEKCLPINNHLTERTKYFETLEDIDQDTLLSIPFLILRL